jgi:hypothetical protein
VNVALEVSDARQLRWPGYRVEVQSVVAVAEQPPCFVFDASYLVRALFHEGERITEALRRRDRKSGTPVIGSQN